MVYIYINDRFYKLRTEHRSIGCIAGTNYTQFFVCVWDGNNKPVNR